MNQSLVGPIVPSVACLGRGSIIKSVTTLHTTKQYVMVKIKKSSVHVSQNIKLDGEDPPV